MKMFIPYIATLVLFAGIDVVWLGFVANRFYRAELGSLMAQNFNVGAAVAFYFIYALGTVIFAISPTLASGTWRDALLWGALFGFFAYATYDLTNLATLKGWPMRLTFVDLAWGTVLTGMVSALVHIIAQKF